MQSPPCRLCTPGKSGSHLPVQSGKFPLTNCFLFIVSSWRTLAKCSGAKVGIPSYANFLPGIQIVSPMEKMPGSNTRSYRRHMLHQQYDGHSPSSAAGKDTFSFLPAHRESFDSGIEFAGADAHECDTVTVCFVHVCLDFKDKRREILLIRRKKSITPSLPVRGSGGIVIVRTVLQGNLHTKVGERGIRKNTGENSPLLTSSWVKLCACAIEQLDIDP